MYGRGGSKTQFTQQDLAALASAYDPTYSASNQPIVAQTNKEYTAGLTGRNVVALNTAMRHISQMNDLAYALNNGNIQAANYVKNLVKEWTGSSVPTNVSALAPMVSSEVAKMLSGAGVQSQEQIENVQKMFNTAKSYQQLADGIKEALKLTAGRATELRSGYERGLGNVKSYRVVSPENVKMFEKFGIPYDEGVPEEQGARPQQGGQQPQTLSNDDIEAIKWARANPKDPRSAKILKLHGIQ